MSLYFVLVPVYILYSTLGLNYEWSTRGSSVRVCPLLSYLPPIITMSGTGPRESIFPTRMALTNTKARLKGAQTGHSLLAKKRDALTTRFRAILRKVDEVSPPPSTSKKLMKEKKRRSGRWVG